MSDVSYCFIQFRGMPKNKDNTASELNMAVKQEGGTKYRKAAEVRAGRESRYNRECSDGGQKGR